MLNTPSLWAKVIYIDSSGCCKGGRVVEGAYKEDQYRAAMDQSI